MALACLRATEPVAPLRLRGICKFGAQGGGDFSDLEIARAVVYLANKGGGKFSEPAAPAAAASAAAGGASAPK